MKILRKNLIFMAMAFSVVLVLSAIMERDNFSTNENISTMNYSSNNKPVFVLDPNFKVGNPIMNTTSFSYEGIDTKFILYEDFPINTPSYFNNGDIRIENLPDNTWAKLIRSNSSHYGETTLRLMGAVKPLVSNPFNETISLSDRPGNNIIVKTSLPIVRNGIMGETSVIRDSIPVKFKHEILARSNSKILYIFGIVYDPTFFNGHFIQGQSTGIHNLMNINIEPIGLVKDGNLTKIPTWLQIKTMNLPLVLTVNEPNYYVIGLSTVNAPTGSYEVELRETINQRIFLETITLTIINPEN